MPSFKCKDAGIPCGYKAEALTMKDLMKKITVHVERTHHMKTIPPETMAKIKAAIRE